MNCYGRFAWYELVTTDTDSAKTFYQDVMGWGALDASQPHRAYTLFTAGSTLVGGVMGLTRDSAERGGRSGWLGYVEVSDVDTAAERIKTLGGVVHLPPTDVPHISRYCIFADPQAARLAVLNWLNPAQRRSSGSLAPGRVGWHELLAANWASALDFYIALFGWQKTDTEIGDPGHYQTFAADGKMIGGVVTKPETITAPFWLYYFQVADLTAATQRVNAAGGRILGGPFEFSGGSGIVQCADPQGAVFALEGKSTAKAIGYFKDPRGGQWSW